MDTSHQLLVIPTNPPIRRGLCGETGTGNSITINGRTSSWMDGHVVTTSSRQRCQLERSVHYLIQWSAWTLKSSGRLWNCHFGCFRLGTHGSITISPAAHSWIPQRNYENATSAFGLATRAHRYGAPSSDYETNTH